MNILQIFCQFLQLFLPNIQIFVNAYALSLDLMLHLQLVMQKSVIVELFMNKNNFFMNNMRRSSGNTVVGFRQ